MVVGDKEIDCKVATVTFNCAVPLIEFSAAAIVTGPPAVTPVAMPWLLMVAMLVFEEDQVTDAVKS